MIELPERVARWWISGDSGIKLSMLNALASNFFIEGQKLHYTLKEPFTLMSKTTLSERWLGRKDSNL
jgi:hypothetical protein